MSKVTQREIGALLSKMGSLEQQVRIVAASCEKSNQGWNVDFNVKAIQTIADEIFGYQQTLIRPLPNEPVEIEAKKDPK